MELGLALLGIFDLVLSYFFMSKGGTKLVGIIMGLDEAFDMSIENPQSKKEVNEKKKKDISDSVEWLVIGFLLSLAGIFLLVTTLM